ncbi:MAG TPA: sigma-70 family RNA polymerase sigma factor [Polyangiaceae bacterium]
MTSGEQQSSAREGDSRPSDADPTRLVLVAREMSADELLYERVAPLVNRMVWMYLPNDPERDDVAQDILVSILRRAHSLRDPALLEAWAGRVAFNAICNLFRRRKFRRWLSLDSLREDDEAELHVDFEGRELVVRARRILESLPIAERMPLTLELFGNASQPEIARLCGCSERTVRRRIKAARKHFLAIAGRDPALSLRLGESEHDEGSTDE